MMAMTMYAAPEQQFLAHARKAGIEHTDAEIREMQVKTLEDLKAGNLTVSRDHSATMLGAAVAVEAVTPLLVDMHWTIVQAEIGIEFVLRDAPVTLYSASMAGNKHLGIGFGTPDVEVRTALTPNHAIMQYHRRPELRHVPELMASKEGVENLNHVSWSAAHDYVFARTEDTLRRVATYFDLGNTRRRPGGQVKVTGADLA